MKVVLADIFPEPLEQAVADCGDAGHDVTGVVTDVTDFASVEHLRDEAYATYGAVHVLCNNAGVGAGAEGQIWDHTLNDWGWGLAVNLWGVIHGIKAFVPRDARRRRRGPRDQHVVGQRRHRSPDVDRRSTPPPRPRSPRSPRCSTASSRRVDSRIGVSVLFPGPKVLRTGLLESSRKRPRAWANDVPRSTPYTTIESFEARMRAAGIEPDYTPVEAVAEEAVARHPRGPVLDPARRASAPTSTIRGSRRRRCSSAPTPDLPGANTAMSRYLVISADTPRRPARTRSTASGSTPSTASGSTQFLAERARAAEMASAGFLNEEFAKAWHEENEEGLRGGWDAARRDKELDADGVAGEVIFPDADSVTGGASAPFGAGLGASGDTPGRPAASPAPGPTTGGWPSCARTVPSAGPVWRSCRSWSTSTPRSPRSAAPTSRACGAASSSRRCGSRTSRTTTPATTRCGRCARSCRCRCTCTRASPTAPRTVRTSASSRPRRASGRRVRCWFLIWSGVFERFPGLQFGVAECGAFWVNDLLWRMDLVYERDHGSRKLGRAADGEHVDAPERVLRSQLLHRRVEHRPGRDGPPLRDRRRQPLLGQRLPPSRRARGPTRASSSRGVFCDIPRDETAAMLGGNAAEVYGFDVEALAPLVDRIGPTPEELGQDRRPDGQVGRRQASRVGRG